MADKFLNAGGGDANISNGTINAFLASLTVANLRSSMPVKTNSVNTLVSSKLDITDVNNLESRLDAVDNDIQNTNGFVEILNEKNVNVPLEHNPFIYTTGPPINQDVNRVYLDNESNLYTRSDEGFPKPNALPNYYTGVVIDIDSEPQLNLDLLAAADYDILNITADITLTAVATINKKLKIQSLNGSRITFSSASNIFSITSGEVWFDGLTFNNPNSGSSANILNFTGLTITKNFVTNCIFETNEFAIVSNNSSIQITNNVFKFVGSVDSHRYIMLTGCRGTTFINDNIFQGNGSSTQCININNSIAANFLDGHLIIKNNVSQILAVQRLLMVDINMFGSNFSLYVSSNNMVATSGFIIFYSIPLFGIKQIYVYNNVETLALGISGSKGIIGIDSPGISTLNQDVIIYSAGNVVPELRTDYTDLINPEANQPRVIAYAAAKFTPTQPYDVIVPFIKQLSGGEDSVKNPLESDINAAGFSITNLTNINNINVDELENKTQYMSTLISLPPITKFQHDIEADNFIKVGGTNKEYLMADGSSLQFSANSGNSNYYLYTNSTQLNIDPPDGEVTYNNAIQSAATILYISHRTRDNIDVEVFFKNISVLQDVYIQDQAISENYIRYNITGTPVITVDSKVTIPVAVIESMGTGVISFGNNTKILLSFFTNNIETDLRLSTLENKTQNITANATGTNLTKNMTLKLASAESFVISDNGSPFSVNKFIVSNTSTQISSVPLIMNNQKITLLGAPTNNGDATSKIYVDNSIIDVSNKTQNITASPSITSIIGKASFRLNDSQDVFSITDNSNPFYNSYMEVGTNGIFSLVKHTFNNLIEPATDNSQNIGSEFKRFALLFSNSIITNSINSSSGTILTSGIINMDTNRIINMAGPVNNLDAANKGYVDTIIAPLSTKTQNISASLNANSISGQMGIRLNDAIENFAITDNDGPFYTGYFRVSSSEIFSQVKHTFNNLIEPALDLGVSQNIGSVSKRFNTLFCNLVNAARVTVGTPTLDTDATNKLYVDNTINGLSSIYTKVTGGSFNVQWTGGAGGTIANRTITFKRISDGTNTMVWLTLGPFTVTIGTASNFGVRLTTLTMPSNLWAAAQPHLPICVVFNGVVQCGWLVNFANGNLGVQPGNKATTIIGQVCGISNTSIVSYMI